MTLPQLEAKLERGGGKALGKTHAVGNWAVHPLGDGGAVASNSAQFVKTTKHKDGDAPAGQSAEGLAINFVRSGEVPPAPPRARATPERRRNTKAAASVAHLGRDPFRPPPGPRSVASRAGGLGYGARVCAACFPPPTGRRDGRLSCCGPMSRLFGCRPTATATRP
jgi:hypothetical protein